jgi:uncharacterized ParB-like nuclease family protein
MTFETISIDRIRPFHEVRDSERLAALIASMTERGWDGRPLVVIDCGDYYQAITGSHRWAAANEVGIDEIPSAICECDNLWEDYDMTIDNVRDPEDFMPILAEYDPEAAELLKQN